MTTITNADREAAQALCASGWTHAIEAFARHREQAWREALEEAARSCEASAANARLDVLIERYGDEATQHAADLLSAQASRLRALIGETK